MLWQRNAIAATLQPSGERIINDGDGLEDHCKLERTWVLDGITESLNETNPDNCSTSVLQDTQANTAFLLFKPAEWNFLLLATE